MTGRIAEHAMEIEESQRSTITGELFFTAKSSEDLHTALLKAMKVMGLEIKEHIWQSLVPCSSGVGKNLVEGDKRDFEIVEEAFTTQGSNNQESTSYHESHIGACISSKS